MGPKPPKPQRPPPAMTDMEVQQKAEDQRRRALLAMGRQSTILTQQNAGRLGEVNV